MAILKIILIVLMVLFGAAGNGLANEELVIEENASEKLVEEEVEVDPFAGLDKKVSLDLRGMDIIDTLKFLAKQGNLNIVATKSVSGKVTLFLNDVTIAVVLEIILLTNGLACEEKGSILTIMTEREYEALYGVKFISKKESKTITLKYADPKRVGAILASLKSTIGKIIIDEATGMIILIDTPEKIEEMEEAAKKVDIPTISRIIPTITEEFELEYAKVGEIKGEIDKALTKDIGSLRADERTNKLVITDLPHNMEIIRDLVTAFDAKTREVLIEAKIIQITLSDDYAMGVDWRKILSSADGLTFGGSFPFSSPSSTSSSFAVDVGTFDTHNYEFALSLIKSVGKMQILSAPHIVVCNNEEAKFMVGAREAYVTSTITTGEVTTTTAESVEFIDVGVTLYVTPTINKGGFVRMHIKPEISSVEDWLETTEGNRIPIVSTANVETDVLVKDGRTIIIAGLIKETEEKDLSKIPILGNIPVLGGFFKNVSDLYEKKELVILLTPHIISGGEDITYIEEDEKARKLPK
ncbi:MAG: hypothetical protein ISS45_01190 [Candidatus Omnitrophica bacterium]|nr:hypothetical protein [Candidatus Omnitrophota bacterium]